MNLKDLRERTVNRAKKLISSPELKRAKVWTVQTSKKLRNNFVQARDSLSKQLAASNEDDLIPLKRKLEQMQEDAKNEH